MTARAEPPLPLQLVLPQRQSKNLAPAPPQRSAQAPAEYAEPAARKPEYRNFGAPAAEGVVYAAVEVSAAAGTSGPARNGATVYDEVEPE